VLVFRVVVWSRKDREQVIFKPFGLRGARTFSSFVQQADVDWNQVDTTLRRSHRRVQGNLKPEPGPSPSRFAFYSLRAKLTKTDVTANTSRSSPQV